MNTLSLIAVLEKNNFLLIKGYERYLALALTWYTPKLTDQYHMLIQILLILISIQLCTFFLQYSSINDTPASKLFPKCSSKASKSLS